MNAGASIDHECDIGAFGQNPLHHPCNIHVGKGSWIGAGTTVIPFIRIGEWVTIGAVSVVLHDIPPHTTVAGILAKTI